MPSAFVFVNCQLRFTPDVLENLRKLPEVEQAYNTHGMYDIVVKLRSENNDDLRESVVRIRRIDGISSTFSMIILEEAEEEKKLQEKRKVQSLAE
jgi:DNA-binding Lrp family transcriptional regulator